MRFHSQLKEREEKEKIDHGKIKLYQKKIISNMSITSKEGMTPDHKNSDDI